MPTPKTGVRAPFVAALKPLLPKGWQFFPYRKVTDAISATTVFVVLSKIEKLPEAPQSAAFLVTFTVTIVSPAADIAEADADLDDDVITLAHAIDALPFVRRTSGEQGVTASQNLGFDISVEVIVPRTPNKE